MTSTAKSLSQQLHEAAAWCAGTQHHTVYSDADYVRLFKLAAARIEQSDPVAATKPDPFMAGFAAAITCVVRQHDEPTIAADAIAGYGLTLENFNHVDDFDLPIIKRLFETEGALK